MRIVDEKIDKFAHDIMNDVSRQRNKVMEQTEKELEDIFEEKELEYLSKAYEVIQSGLKSIHKEKNEILSRAIMDSKRDILKARNDMIKAIFADAEKDLIAHTKSETYYDELCQMIKEGIMEIGEGDLKIFIAYTDKQHLHALEKKFDQEIVLEDKHEKMIGGCKIYNQSKNLYLDNSFYTKLYGQKETFLQQCKLEIE